MERLDNRAGIERHEHDPTLNKDFYELEEEVQRETYFENTHGILVFSGLPPIKSSKYAKFMKHLKKELAKQNVDWDEHVVAFYLPLGDEARAIDEDDPPEGLKTHGLFFIELNNQNLATKLLNNLHGTSFSKSSTWCITPWEEWLQAEEIAEEFKGPSFEDFQSSNSIRKWLEDPEGRDQILIRSLDKMGDVDYHRCSVWWGDHRRNGAVLETNFESTLAKLGKKVLTDSEACWSPLGSYVTSKHDGRGVQTWCQERGDWVLCNRFEHMGTEFFDWSPNETYLITLAFEEDDSKGEKAMLQLWNAKTGEPRRKLDATYHYNAGFKWPYLKWSNDDKYFAWIHTSKWKKSKEKQNLGKADADRFVVFEADTCRRLDSKAVDCPNIRLLTFSPGPRRIRGGENKPLIAFGTKGSKDKPTSICLMEIPTKQRVCTSPHFDVFNADLLWHPNGQWLCSKIAKKRRKKKKKGQIRGPEDQIASFGLTIFNCGHEDIPRDTIQLGRETIIDFQWEPTRPRLCILQKAQLNESIIRIFDFKGIKSREVLHPSPKYIQVESIHWSPAGRHICLHHAPNGDRTFFDTETLKDKRQTHEGAAEVAWDPSGRFLVSSVVSDLGLADEGYGAATDNGWVMYNFQGEKIAQQDFKGGNGKQKQCLFSFQWRPRPPSLLLEKQKKEIEKTLKKTYWDEFKRQDEEIFRKSASKKMKDRLDKQQEWQLIMEELHNDSEQFAKERIALRDGRESEDEDEYDYEMIEEQEPISYIEEEVTVEELEQLS